MTPEQFAEWRAYDSLETIGLDRLYQVLACVGKAVCEALGAPIDGFRFLPWIDPAEIEQSQTAEEQIAEVRRFASQRNSGA